MRPTIKIVAGVLMALLINGILSELYRRGPAQRSSKAVWDAAFYEYPHDVELLMMGSSHIGMQVDARIMGPNAFTLSTPGESYIQTYYRLRYVLEHTDHPIDTVVLPASLHSFIVQQTTRMDVAPWPKYLDYWEIGAEFGERTNYALKFARNALVPYAGRFEDFVIEANDDWSVEETIEMQGTKFIPDREMDAETLKYLSAVRVRDHFWEGMKQQFWFDERVARYLEKVLDLAQEHDIRVVLVRTPLAEEYWRLANERIDVEYLDRRVADFIQGRSKVSYLDYYDLYFDRPELFFDGDHLGEAGSAIFTEHLARELEKIRD